MLHFFSHLDRSKDFTLHALIRPFTHIHTPLTVTALQVATCSLGAMAICTQLHTEDAVLGEMWASVLC